jgi:hypothetical protein
MDMSMQHVLGGAINHRLKCFFFNVRIGLHVLLKFMLGMKSTGWCELDSWLTIYSILTSLFLAQASRQRRNERHFFEDMYRHLPVPIRGDGRT